MVLLDPDEEVDKAKRWWTLLRKGGASVGRFFRAGRNTAKLAESVQALADRVAALEAWRSESGAPIRSTATVNPEEDARRRLDGFRGIAREGIGAASGIFGEDEIGQSNEWRRKMLRLGRNLRGHQQTMWAQILSPGWPAHKARESACDRADELEAHISTITTKDILPDFDPRDERWDWRNL